MQVSLQIKRRRKEILCQLSNIKILLIFHAAFMNVTIFYGILKPSKTARKANNLAWKFAHIHQQRSENTYIKLQIGYNLATWKTNLTKKFWFVIGGKGNLMHGPAHPSASFVRNNVKKSQKACMREQQLQS